MNHLASKGYESAWSKSIPIRQQLKIMKRLMGYTKPYKRQFVGAIVAAALLAGMNVLLPFILQQFMDRYLANQSATVQILLLFAALYALARSLKLFSNFFRHFYSTWAQSAA